MTRRGRSKREQAPPPLQTGSAAAAAPWWPSVALPGTPFGDAMAPPPGGQPAWWTGPLPQSTSSSIVSPDCGMDLHPAGGFLSYLQTGQQPFIPPHALFPAPWPPVSKESLSAPPTDSGTQHDASGSKARPFINIDDGDDVRTAKRLVWTPDEDVRLASAWLYNSNDPINGNCKKNDNYWADVLAMYNNTTPTNRKREVKHLKDRWQKVKRWVRLFCGSWKKAISIYASGQSDDQLRDKAMKFYLDDYQEGPFTVMHLWKVLRDEPKWHAILEDQEKPNKRKLDDEGEVRDIMAMPEVAGEKERPIGTKEAKKQRNGKGKAKDDDTCLDEDMKKYMEIQAAATKCHEDFLETQQCVSDAKVEAARLNRESTVLETYKSLMTMDTREMTDEMKAELVEGLKILREKLGDNTG